ncbi:MAG: hypothetical protein RMM98_05640 [Acidobacteriota bacterium]|nr:hypothetical protein [Blastocatellia bacterium]MDW8239078.1 hypothetical protein [Acidobacteriota bacterium]
MKKLLAFGGLASSATVWAMTSILPQILGILLVLTFRTLIPPAAGVPGTNAGYGFVSGGVGATLIDFMLAYFRAGGITQNEMVIGL